MGMHSADAVCRKACKGSAVPRAQGQGCVHAQVMVVPISTASAEYAKEVKAALRKESFSVDVDLVDNKMEKKIREAQLEQYNYIVVCLTIFALLALFSRRTLPASCCTCRWQDRCEAAAFMNWPMLQELSVHLGQQECTEEADAEK